MTTKEIKELYATGEWILISKMQLCNWHKTNTFDLQENSYKLIHKKHADVLDHWLNVNHEIFYRPNKVYAFIECYDFIESYNPDWEYEFNFPNSVLKTINDGAGYKPRRWK